MSWPTTRLDECTRIVGGATPSTSNAALWDGNICWATPRDLSELDGVFIDDTPRKLTAAGLAACSAEVLPRGSVLFSSRAPIGHVAINTRPMATNQGFKSFVPDERRITAGYLYWWLRSNSDYMKSLGNGATFKEVSKAVVSRVTIPLPPLDDQRRIAAILDQADALRRKRRDTIDWLDQLGQAIFREMFGDRVTNPMGWETVKLGDVCDVGSSKRVFVDEFVAEGVPFYRGTEVGKLARREVIQPYLFIAPGHYEDLISHSGKPEIGDLLLPSICHDGRIWRVDSEEPFYFKDGRVLWIRNNETVLDSEYLRNYLRTAFLRDYLSIASGTTFAELKIVNLKVLPILSPPLKLQVEFSKRIREVEACRLSFVRSEMMAESLFVSLQLRAFRGELTRADERTPEPA